MFKKTILTLITISMAGLLTTSVSKAAIINVGSANDQWKTTPYLFSPQMAWETGVYHKDILQKTHGKNHNIIYYYQPKPDILHVEIKTAVNNWNRLNVLKLVRTNNKKLANFTITFNDDPKPNRKASGVTIFKNKGNTKAKNDYFTNVHIYIEPLVAIYQHRSDRVNVIEHEIGHALGFAHDNQLSYDPTNDKYYAATIMNAGNETVKNKTQVATIPLGQREANNLKEHYHLK